MVEDKLAKVVPIYVLSVEKEKPNAGLAFTKSWVQFEVKTRQKAIKQAHMQKILKKWSVEILVLDHKIKCSTQVIQMKKY